MDPMALAGMIFTLITLVLIGGFILLFPLTRQLGKVLEQRLEDKRPPALDRADVARLREALESLERQVQSLTDRQEFVEGLLRGGERVSLPRGDAAEREI
jgi:hypothetical protein